MPSPNGTGKTACQPRRHAGWASFRVEEQQKLQGRIRSVISSICGPERDDSPVASWLNIAKAQTKAAVMNEERNMNIIVESDNLESVMERNVSQRSLTSKIG